MAKYLILKKRRDFLKAAKDITMTANNVMIQAVFCSEKDKSDSPRVGFTATKRLGKAYYRNLTKRRLRAVCRELAQKRFLKNVDYVFVGRRDTAVCDYKKLKEDVIWALRKTNYMLLNKQNDKTNEKIIHSAD